MQLLLLLKIVVLQLPLRRNDYICIKFTNNIIIIFMEDDFDAYKIQVDSDCVSSDFDDYDLYGEIMEESDDDFGDDFELE